MSLFGDENYAQCPQYFPISGNCGLLPGGKSGGKCKKPLGGWRNCGVLIKSQDRSRNAAIFRG